MVVEDMANLLSPRQLGYGVRNGAEAAVHATLRFVMDMEDDHAFLKLDLEMHSLNTPWQGSWSGSRSVPGHLPISPLFLLSPIFPFGGRVGDFIPRGSKMAPHCVINTD